MLANRLPLLQNGLETAGVQGAVPAFCLPDGPTSPTVSSRRSN